MPWLVSVPLQSVEFIDATKEHCLGLDFVRACAFCNELLDIAQASTALVSNS